MESCAPVKRWTDRRWRVMMAFPPGWTKPEMTAFRDLAGQSFSRLTALERGEDQVRRTGKRLVVWRCRCDCGAEVSVRSDHLTRGKIQSCGCWRRDQPTKHGGAYGLEYNSWQNLIQRTTNPKNPGYDYYGGRGITVCERWKDFANFIADMGPRPDPRMSIERRDNDRGYEPDNCKWASPSEQMRNSGMRTNNTSGATGVVLDKQSGRWHAQIHILGKNISCGTYVEFEEALAARQRANVEYGFSPKHGNPRAIL